LHFDNVTDLELDGINGMIPTYVKVELLIGFVEDLVFVPLFVIYKFKILNIIFHGMSVYSICHGCLEYAIRVNRRLKGDGF
jgi:retron-type reverse transcriptase